MLRHGPGVCDAKPPREGPYGTGSCVRRDNWAKPTAKLGTWTHNPVGLKQFKRAHDQHSIRQVAYAIRCLDGRGGLLIIEICDDRRFALQWNRHVTRLERDARTHPRRTAHIGAQSAKYEIYGRRSFAKLS